MSRNGNGVYTLVNGNPVVTGTTITSTWANNTLTDIASALTDSVAADGQTPMTGDLDLNSNKIVNLAPAAFVGEAVEYSQLVAATSVVTITGGTINGATIGATTPASGRFTTLESTGNTTVGGNLSVTGTSTFTGLGSFNGTGALKIPVGTTAQQPSPVTGQIRYNTTNSNFEGYYASGWSSLGSAAGSNTQVQYNNGGILAGSSAFTFDGTVLTVPKITFATSNTPSLTNYQGGAITSVSSVLTTSGTSIDFTDIPSWVKRITVLFNRVGTNGTSGWQIRLGTASGIEATGYNGAGMYQSTAVSSVSSTTGIYFNTLVSASFSGSITINALSSNTWVASGSLGGINGNNGIYTGSSKTLTGGSGVLDRIRFLTVNGTDAFNDGSVSLLLE